MVKTRLRAPTWSDRAERTRRRVRRFENAGRQKHDSKPKKRVDLLKINFISIVPSHPPRAGGCVRRETTVVYRETAAAAAFPHRT